MKRAFLTFLACLAWAAAATAGGPPPAAEKAPAAGEYITLRVPLFSDRLSDLPVAVVNGEPISLEDLRKTVGSRHEQVSEGKTAAAADLSKVLGLLVNAKLITQEGRNIGLDELPEVKADLEKYSKATLRELLQKRQLAGIAPDAAEVEKTYKELVREYGMKLVMFEDEAAAGRMKQELKTGKTFEELADRAVAEKAARRQDEQRMKAKDLSPQIAQVMAGLKEGEASGVVKIPGEKGTRFVLAKLDTIRFPDDPGAREEAGNSVLSKKQWSALFAYNKALARKYVKLDRKVFDSIDYGRAGRTFEQWLADKRVIARIKGDAPLTVGEISGEVKRKYFHGVDAQSAKRITKQRLIEVYEAVVAKKILLLEAVKQGIDKTQEYKDKVRDYESSLVFGLFIRNVVEPESRLKEEDVKAYYNEHLKDYTYPEMVQLSTLAFATGADAEAALTKLQKGDDFLWVKDNAEGQAAGTDDPLKFELSTLFVTDLPEALRKVATGAKAGTYGIFNEGGQSYVAYIRDVIPSKAQPFEEVRETIARKLYNEKINKVTADWAAKLSASSEVKVYLATSDTK